MIHFGWKNCILFISIPGDYITEWEFLLSVLLVYTISSNMIVECFFMDVL